MPSAADLLERYVRVPTQNPGGDERVLARLVRDDLAAHAPDELTVVESPRALAGDMGAWVYARWGRPSLLVNAHLDTVPPNAGWTGDPFTPRVGGGRMTGLGTADTKGAIAAIVAALAEGPPADTAILFSGDEELGGAIARAFLDTPAAQGLRHAIVCEPTGLAVGTRHRGVLALEARLQGAGGHSSGADRMPAPLADLARLAVAWHDWGKERAEVGPEGFHGTCMNIAKLDGGVAFNVVPDQAMLTASLRPAPGSDQDAMLAELVAIAARVAPAAQVSAPIANPPLDTRAPADFVRWLDAAARPVDLDFWTEAALFASVGIDAVVYGPGAIGCAHAPDEWVALDELEAARAAFARAFAETRRAARG